MSLTKEQWAEIERKLGSPWGSVALVVPGHRLVLAVKPIGKLRFAPAVYVDGFVRGEWLHALNGNPEHPIGVRFYQKRTRRLVPKAKAEAAFKALKPAFGKAEATRMSGLNHVYSYRLPTWTSARALIAHLRKNEPEIQLAPAEECAP